MEDYEKIGAGGQPPQSHFMAGEGQGCRADYIVAMLLFLTAFFSLYLTIEDIGVTWDEAYLCDDASKLYVEWFSRAIKDIKNGSLDFASKETVDRYFGAVIEGGNVNWHPPFARMLSGITWKLFNERIGELRAFRLSPIIIFSLEVSLLYLFVRRLGGYGGGIFASLSLLLMPRVFGDAHLFTLDTPIAFMCLLTAYSFSKGVDKKGWAVITGIVWGLALNTKVHAFFMPMPLFLWAVLFKKKYINNLISMLLLSPLVYIASWPWLWHDTIAHIFGFSIGMGDIVVKSFNHPVAYMGTVYAGGTPPWHYPWIMIFITTPPLTILFAFAGIWNGAKQQPLTLMFILCIATFLVLFSLPFTPKYDGVRLLSPVFPFLAGTAGAGFHFISGKRRFIAPLIGGLALIFSLISLIRIHPFESSYYNIFIGGLKGASDSGFDVTYYGDSFNRDVIDFINKKPPDTKFGYRGGPFKEQVIFYTDMGQLPEGFIQNQPYLWNPNYKGAYDYFILYNRKSNFDELSWFYFKNLKPVYSLTAQGIPLLNIYQTPENIERQSKYPYPSPDPLLLNTYWEGLIKISEDGEYGFAVYANGKVSMAIDNRIVVNCEERFKEGEISLKRGFHSMEIRYNRKSEAPYLYLLWKSAGDDKYQVITPDALFPINMAQFP